MRKNKLPKKHKELDIIFMGVKDSFPVISLVIYMIDFAGKNLHLIKIPNLGESVGTALAVRQKYSQPLSDGFAVPTANLYRGIAYTSCRSHMGMDHCGQSLGLLLSAPASHFLMDLCSHSPARDIPGRLH